MTNLIPLNTFLRTERDYVQGTQLIARTAELIAVEGLQFVSASFYKITDRQIAVEFSEKKVSEIPVIGSVTFSKFTDEFKCQLIELSLPSPRRNSPLMIKTILLNRQKTLSGRFHFGGVSGFEDILNALVQGIKSMHQALGETVYDIWLTGFRGFQLPAQYPAEFKSGTAFVDLVRSSHSENLYQTLLKVEMRIDCTDTNFNGFVTFCFKSESEIYVH